MATSPLSEAVPVKTPENNGPMKSHSICTLCYPEDFLGIKALCGETLLGIKADPKAPICDPCEKCTRCPVCGQSLNEE